MGPLSDMLADDFIFEDSNWVQEDKASLLTRMTADYYLNQVITKCSV